MKGGITHMEKTETNGSLAHALPIFLGGMAAGMALTVLLAPRSGAATRRLIGREVKAGENWVRTKASAAQDSVGSHGGKLRDRVKETAAVIGGGRERSAPAKG